MAVLPKELRNKLEAAVKTARDAAEPGARAALEQLAVDAAEPYSHMNADARELRNRLRARARQLGDRRDARSGTHEIEHLVVECAYQHWHRMLFARFLAENKVLMHPDGVAVTLEECQELAEHEGATDGWDLAARYAARMLPQIFRPDAPVLQVRFPPENQRKLEQLLADLPAETFTASDALGWVYQFWQAKRKDEVNKSEVKIGADELPAVTQLFTEPYMVDFLLQNTLGAWWVDRHGRVSLPLEMPYLRFLEDGTPAAGTFDGWPETAAEITVLDPCCGSGHFLVAAFHILVRFRMAEEGLSPAAACDAVLRDNLHGLEIDERCTQIAAFALALAAWTFPRAGGYRTLPELNVACSGLAPRAKKEDWLALAREDTRARVALECLYEMFADAPTLGSLIDPSTVGLDANQQLIHVARFQEIQPMLRAAIERDDSRKDADRHELGVSAKGIVAAARILSAEYDLVCTNVPFLTSGKQSDVLKEFCRARHFDARYDLATCVIARIVEGLKPAGTAAFVSPHNWLFLGSYKALRKALLRSATWRIVARLGARAFETISGEVVGVGLVVFSMNGGSHAPVCGIEASDRADSSSKALWLLEGEIQMVSQAQLLRRPDSRITFTQDPDHALLSDFVDCHQGLATGDLPRFGAFFWEQENLDGNWLPWQSTVRESIEYGGRSKAILWEGGEGKLHAFNEAHKAVRKNTHLRGIHVLGRQGVVITQVGNLPATLYTGEHYDDNTTVMVPKDASILPALWAYVSSTEYAKDVRGRDASLKVPAHTLTKVPWDATRWTEVAAEKYPNGLPEPFSDDLTQWIFRGIVRSSTAPLQVAVARFLGYRWPEQIDDGLDDLIDEDGIVCIPAVRGEESAAHRLQALLARAYGDDWSTQKREEVLRAVGCAGKGLDYWLREKFFEQHSSLFHHRPFVWHVWDGLKRDGFAALVNYHKLDRKLLETLTYNYLGDWIKRQEDGVRGSLDGAEERLQAARELQKKLELILRGEPPYDIFVRWKPLHEQPMGWEPDLNDGVRINIRPFMTAGVLRHNRAPKLNITWTKDRGKDPDDAPWYHLGPKYGGKEGDRINDHHLTLDEKRQAREEQGVRV